MAIRSSECYQRRGNCMECKSVRKKKAPPLLCECIYTIFPPPALPASHSLHNFPGSCSPCSGPCVCVTEQGARLMIKIKNRSTLNFVNFFSLQTKRKERKAMIIQGKKLLVHFQPFRHEMPCEASAGSSSPNLQ